eukprot:2369986-Pyramimonas_sp.AAC.1
MVSPRDRRDNLPGQHGRALALADFLGPHTTEGVGAPQIPRPLGYDPEGRAGVRNCPIRREVAQGR